MSKFTKGILSAKHGWITIIVIVIAFVLIWQFTDVTKYVEEEILHLLNDDSSSSSNNDGSSSSTPSTPDTTDDTPNDTSDEDDEDEPDTPPSWSEVGSQTGWTFVGGGDMHEQTISFDGTYADVPNKVQISRKWHFADMFEHEAGEGSVVWCLHDSNNAQCWHREDTNCIYNFLTEYSDTGCNYDGSSWTFFIGNNYAERLDCDWIVTLYAYI